jgi:hypothetical protein
MPYVLVSASRRMSRLIDQPPVRHEIGGEPVEQLRMRGRLTQDAKVVHRGDDAPSE